MRYGNTELRPLPVPVQPGELAVALDALPHGLCILDSHDLLQFYNQRFLDLFAPDGVELGACVSDLLGAAPPIREGTVGERNGAAQVALLDHARMTAGRIPATLRHQFPDGRVFEITHTPIENGGAIQLYQDVTGWVVEEAKLRHTSQHDALTGLPNRSLFRACFAQAVARQSGTREGSALLMLDMDRFKDVNDTLGHAVGDRLLQGVVIRIKRCLRKADIFARLGGDEFGIIVGQIGSEVDALALAQRINAAIEQPFRLDGHQIYAALSIGIALFGGDTQADDPSDLMRCADIAMYRAKAEGRNSCRVFETEMDVQLRQRKALEHDLLEAMNRDEFFLQYQPQIDFKQGEICGVEALLRWRHPERGLVPPAVFIELAEELGLIAPLGEWVLRTACLQAKAWPGLSIAVNVSPIQLRDVAFAERLDLVLEETGLASHRLEIEITEGVLLHSTDRVMTTLQRLVARGVKIALDDFGTGYSNLAYLQKFSWNKLKIDRSFVSGLGKEAGSAAIVRSVLALGHGLGVRVIAEGIETERQMELLKEAKCDEGQGYILGAPMDADVFEDYRANWVSSPSPA